MPLDLTYNADTPIPVEIEGLTPTALQELSLNEIRQQECFHGNEKLSLGDLFSVSGDPGDLEWHLHGDLSGVHWIGAHMTGGKIHVHGSAGRHIGSEMRGGEIIVDGDVSDWVGGEMRGGLIRINGRAGHLIGAAYRGSRVGMRGGTILIAGDAGNEVGHTMRRGWIVVGGKAGDTVGFNMLAGTVLVMGECGIRPGAGMRRGTLALFGSPRVDLLPTFRFDCRHRPLVMQLLAKQLDGFEMGFDTAPLRGELDQYHGDLLDGGRGEVLFPAA